MNIELNPYEQHYDGVSLEAIKKDVNSHYQCSAESSAVVGVTVGKDVIRRSGDGSQGLMADIVALQQSLLPKTMTAPVDPSSNRNITDSYHPVDSTDMDVMIDNTENGDDMDWISIPQHSKEQPSLTTQLLHLYPDHDLVRHFVTKMESCVTAFIVRHRVKVDIHAQLEAAIRPIMEKTCSFLVAVNSFQPPQQQQQQPQQQRYDHKVSILDCARMVLLGAKDSRLAHLYESIFDIVLNTGKSQYPTPTLSIL